MLQVAYPNLFLHNITKYFIYLGYERILVTTGYISSRTGHENGRVSEVIDLVDPNRSCSPLQDAPSARWASVGGNLNGRPLICGGWYPNNRLQDCFFVQGNTNQKISLTQERSSAGVVVLNGKKLHFNNQLIKQWVTHYDKTF